MIKTINKIIIINSFYFIFYIYICINNTNNNIQTMLLFSRIFLIQQTCQQEAPSMARTSKTACMRSFLWVFYTYFK